MTELTKLLFSLKGVFTNVVARWPGSTYDSHVFRTSNICTYLQNTHRSLDDGVLLGDSGYASSPFLMAPYTTTRNEAQEAYNNDHAKTRVIIEQTIGRWKRRFHVLHGEIRMAPRKVCLIVRACAVLHNIAVQLHEPMEDQEVDLLADVDPYHRPQLGTTSAKHFSLDRISVFSVMSWFVINAFWCVCILVAENAGFWKCLVSIFSFVILIEQKNKQAEHIVVKGLVH